MPGRTLFPQGIPTSILSDRARQLAEELDKSSLVQRGSPAAKNDGKVDADEIRSALANVDQFDAETAGAVKELAQALGVEVGPAAPKKWLERTSEGFNYPVAAATMGDKAVVLDPNSSGNYPTIRTYDPANDQWGKIELPGNWWGRTKDSRLATDKDGLYFMAANFDNGRPVGWGLRYDANARSFQDIPANPKPWSRSAYASVGGNLYAAGGSPHGYDATAQNTMMMFEKASGTWKEMPPLPVPRYGASAIEVGGKLAVVGGSSGAPNYSPIDRVDIFDPATGQWQNPPLRVGTATSEASLWAEGNLLHVTGGSNTNGRTNTNHEILDITNGKISDGVPLPADSNRLFATNVGGRTFAFGETGGNNSKSFTREWGSDAPPPPAVVNNNTTVNNNSFNLNVVNVDLTVVNNTVNNFVNLTAINVTNKVTINDTRLSLGPIDLDCLPSQAQGKGEGCFDPDNDFFLRTSQDNKPLLRQGKDSAGQRFLVGVSESGKSAVPKNRGELFAFHPETKTLIPFKSDAQGQFAIPVPPGLKGELRIFQMQNGLPSGAATVQLAD
jgi:hypothetical protein